MRRNLAAFASTLVVLAGCLVLTANTPGLAQQRPGNAIKPRRVQKTDAEWKKLLTPMQYYVTRQKGTEVAGTGKYAHTKTAGTYYCVGCGAPLFSSKAKFESGTGWPSFYMPIAERNIEREMDYSTGTPRVEVMCNDCGAHLGHVFDDGPPPTGLRYCMNSAALKFEPQAAAKAKAKKDQTEKEKPEGAEPPTSPGTEKDR
jgi:peptide-methionine (R)-S-oxide reductase